MLTAHRLAFRLVAVLSLLVLFSPSKLLAATLEVGPSGYPYTAIQDAIDAADPGDTVLVHDGTYIETINFNDKAITVRSQNGPSFTAIDGSGGGGSVVTFISGEGDDSILDGFTLQNGSASNGGGIYIQNSSPTITHCRITGNNATNDGGGIYCIKQPNPPIDCAPTIEDSTISGNHAGGSGGGIDCDLYARPVISNCRIEGNSATSGGGIDSYAAFPGIYNNSAASRHGGRRILSLAARCGASGQRVCIHLRPISRG